MGVHASENKNSDLEEDDYPLRASDMKELRNLDRPFYQNIPNLDEKVISKEDPEEEYYHMVTEAKRQLHRQISQYPIFYTTRKDPTRAKLHQLQRKNSLSRITKSQKG